MRWSTNASHTGGANASSPATNARGVLPMFASGGRNIIAAPAAVMAPMYTRAAIDPRPPRIASITVSSVMSSTRQKSHGVSLTKSVSAGRTLGLMN